MAGVRILFVDDEPGIRLSLPALLKLSGFEVVSAATVSEALHEIGKQPFDVLISDLNIGSPGDGFTVVSAMRRTQPDCVTLILTGYPAFETALQAIRGQVDDYLIKPAGVERLVSAIREKLSNRTPHRPIELKRVPRILRECATSVACNILQADSTQLNLPRLHSTEEESQANKETLIHALADQLESRRTELSPVLAGLSAHHGRLRNQQGFDAPTLVEEHRVFADAVFDCVRDNLLAADVSNVVTDLKQVSDVVSSMLRESISAAQNLQSKIA
jgi:DNA-binding response OmpR family regulator